MPRAVATAWNGSCLLNASPVAERAHATCTTVSTTSSLVAIAEKEEERGSVFFPHYSLTLSEHPALALGKDCSYPKGLSARPAFTTRADAHSFHAPSFPCPFPFLSVNLPAVAFIRAWASIICTCSTRTVHVSVKSWQWCKNRDIFGSTLWAAFGKFSHTSRLRSCFHPWVRSAANIKSFIPFFQLPWFILRSLFDFVSLNTHETYWYKYMSVNRYLKIQQIFVQILRMLFFRVWIYKGR